MNCQAFVPSLGHDHAGRARQQGCAGDLHHEPPDSLHKRFALGSDHPAAEAGGQDSRTSNASCCLRHSAHLQQSMPVGVYRAAMSFSRPPFSQKDICALAGQPPQRHLCLLLVLYSQRRTEGQVHRVCVNHRGDKQSRSRACARWGTAQCPADSSSSCFSNLSDDRMCVQALRCWATWTRSLWK